MQVVSSEKAKELLFYLDKNFPEVKIAYKDEPYKNNLMYLIYFFVCLFDLFIKDYKFKFQNNYTTACGNYIYFSSRSKHPVSEFNMRKDTYTILRHEIVHLIQQKRDFFYYFNYLFVLPFVFTMRSKYEYEAYEEQLVASYELYGSISDDYLDSIAKNFYGSMYLWMYPFKEKILARLKVSRSLIQSGQKRSLYLRLSEQKF